MEDRPGNCASQGNYQSFCRTCLVAHFLPVEWYFGYLCHCSKFPSPNANGNSNMVHHCKMCELVANTLQKMPCLHCTCNYLLNEWNFYYWKLQCNIKSPRWASHNCTGDVQDTVLTLSGRVWLETYSQQSTLTLLGLNLFCVVNIMKSASAALTMYKSCDCSHTGFIASPPHLFFIISPQVR